MSLNSEVSKTQTYLKNAWLSISSVWPESRGAFPYGPDKAANFKTNLKNLSAAINSLTSENVVTVPDNYRDSYCFSKPGIDNIMHNRLQSIYNSGHFKKTLCEVHLSDIIALDGSNLFNNYTNLSVIDFSGVTMSDAKLNLTKNPSLKNVEFKNLEYCKAMFDGCKYLRYINTPKLRICSGTTFRSCSCLLSVNLDNLEYAGTGAFFKCQNVTQLKLPKLRVMPSNYGVSVRSSVNVPYLSLTGKGTLVKKTAVTTCDKLTDIYMPNVSATYDTYAGDVSLLCIDVSSEDLRYFTGPKITKYAGDTGFTGYGPTINMSGVLKNIAGNADTNEIKQRLKNISLEVTSVNGKNASNKNEYKEVRILCATAADAEFLNTNKNGMSRIGKAKWYTRANKETVKNSGKYYIRFYSV